MVLRLIGASSFVISSFTRTKGAASFSGVASVLKRG